MSLEILETLRTLGVSVELIGRDRLRLEPASRIPAELVQRIREAKLQIIEDLKRTRPSSVVGSGRQPATAQPKGVAGPCRYDWQRGYAGVRLHCVCHPHAAGTDTIFRTICGGRDTLLEMLGLGVLTGQAERDARRPQ